MSAIATTRRGPRGPYRKSEVEKPFGFMVVYEARIGGRLVEKSFRAKCCQSQARTKALFREGFMRVVRLEPLTERQFGELTQRTRRATKS